MRTLHVVWYTNAWSIKGDHESTPVLSLASQADAIGVCVRLLAESRPYRIVIYDQAGMIARVLTSEAD